MNITSTIEMAFIHKWAWIVPIVVCELTLKWHWGSFQFKKSPNLVTMSFCLPVALFILIFLSIFLSIFFPLLYDTNDVITFVVLNFWDNSFVVLLGHINIMFQIFFSFYQPTTTILSKRFANTNRKLILQITYMRIVYYSSCNWSRTNVCHLVSIFHECHLNFHHTLISANTRNQRTKRKSWKFLGPKTLTFAPQFLLVDRVEHYSAYSIGDWESLFLSSQRGPR